jgi:GNAT superfamily N-acetyltransferase
VDVGGVDAGRGSGDAAVVEITTAAPEDADAVAELHTASWRSACVSVFPANCLRGPLLAERQEVWRARLRTPVEGAALFLVRGAANLLAFAYLEPQADRRILIDNLHARPRHTGRGLGSRLLRHASST